MTSLPALLAAIEAHGLDVLAGVTLVLTCGATVVWCQRGPVQRRYLGVLTAIAALVYLVVAVAPLPRLRGRDAPITVPVVAPDAAQRTARLQSAMAQLTAADAPQGLSGADSSTDSRAGSSEVLRPTEPPAITTARSAALAIPWARLGALVYLVGVGFMLLRRLVGHLRLRAVLAAAQPLPAELSQGLDVPRGVRLLVARHAVRPFCTGIRRPVVVLSPALVASGCVGQARAVLRHELAHLRAGDPAVWTLLAWLAVPLWCHPLVFWLRRDVRFQSELLADDLAATADGREHYARALLELAERSGGEFSAAGTVAAFHRPSEFYRRIQMLLSHPSQLSMSTSRLRRGIQAVAMCGLVAAVAGTFGVPARGQEPAGSLQRQNAELRATVDLLRNELKQLRDQIEVLRGAVDPTVGSDGAPSGAPSLVAESPRVLNQLLQAGAESNGQLTAVNGRQVGSRAEALKLARDLYASGTREFSTTWTVDGREEKRVHVLPGAPGSTSGPLREYAVQLGDTIASIARRELGAANLADDILQANAGLDPVRLKVGQRLRLPARNEPAVPRDPTAVPAAGTATQTGSLERVPAQASGGLGDAVGDPGTSALAALAELTARYLDLQAELEVAQVAAEEDKTLAATGQTSQREAVRSAVAVRTLERKLKIAAQLIDGEIAATEAERVWIERRRAEASPSELLSLDVRANRAATRLQVLRAVR